jgi:hypothetical protein
MFFGTTVSHEIELKAFASTKKRMKAQVQVVRIRPSRNQKKK